MPHKYVIVHFVELDTVPDEFMRSEWPLHITLLANFTLAQPVEELVRLLEQYAQQATPFEVMPNGEALFGFHQSVSVTLIERSEKIMSLHNGLVDLAAPLGAVYDSPKFMLARFRPHVTKKGEARLANNHTLLLDSFTLVDERPDNDSKRRRLIKTFHLGYGAAEGNK